MLKKLLLPAITLGLTLAISLPLTAQEDTSVFYWISHGSEADPIWVLALSGANQAAEDFGVEVRTSLHSNDVASQQEAWAAAIAAGADGIASTSPDPGTLGALIDEARAAGISVVLFNSDDAATNREAYIGTNNVEVGRQWAQYLVDNGHVSEGDFVWMPVEVPGATYQVDETMGIASVFDPLGITYEVFDAGYEQSTALDSMTTYLLANADNVDAIIGLGDLVTGSMQRVFDQVGLAPGDIPVVGWGNSLDTANSVQQGYVQAGMWQYPNSQGYLAISLMLLAESGTPPAFDILTMSMYDASTVDIYIPQLEAAMGN